ncbi:MAG: 50S ribosomal protein L32 [Candidatus Cloacimonetes bacterium 4572_55]|nr:MAG: 50S ribosomal protein L32 [Candidatus Cloacimonetes bacterium 4572_55]
MANPKHKISKSRRNKRRTHWKVKLPGMSTCKNCNQIKLPHRVCKNCGYYNGRQVIEIRERS